MLDNLQPDLHMPDLPAAAAPPRRGAQGADFSLILRLASQPTCIAEAEQLRIIEANPPAHQLLAGGLKKIEGTLLTDYAADAATRVALEQLNGRFFGLEGGRAQETLQLALLDAHLNPLRAEGLAVPVTDAAGKRFIILRFSAGLPVAAAPIEEWVDNQAANYSKLLAGLVDGFIEINRSGQVMVASTSAQRLLEREEHQVVGKLVEEIFPMLTTAELYRIGRLLGDEENPVTRIVAPLLINDEPRQFEFKAHEQAAGLGVIFRDVTEDLRQQLEIAKLNATTVASQELLRRQNDELNQMLGRQATLNDQLTQADTLKGEFLANTSHELRTPLNAIIGSLQLVDEGLCEDAEEQAGYVKNALNSAKQLLALINDLLDITKIEAGKMTFLVENHGVEDLFQEVYSHANVQAQQKGLALEFDLGEDENLTVRVDLHKTIQVFLKIIGNAVKFTDKGKVSVTAQPDPENADMVRFTIIDTGIGVPRMMQQQIFEKFRQGDGSATRRHEGTGLGLAITRNLVEMMGGTIGIFSEGEGCGTTISLTLPRAHMAVAKNVEQLSDEDIDLLLPDTF